MCYQFGGCVISLCADGLSVCACAISLGDVLSVCARMCYQLGGCVISLCADGLSVWGMCYQFTRGCAISLGDVLSVCDCLFFAVRVSQSELYDVFGNETNRCCIKR